MKRISIVGLFLVAAFVLSAMAASGASADLKAQLHGGASIVGTTFLSSATLPQLITKGGSEIHCTDATSHGKFLTATLGDILLRFLGCTSSGVKCNTTNAGTGEIHLPLTTLFHLGLAHLVLASTTDRIPAAVILPETVKISCGIIKIEVRGNVIGAFQRGGQPVPLNTAFEDVNLNFQQTSNGVQQLRLILMPGSTTPTTYDLESTFGLGFELASEVANALLDGFENSVGPLQIELVEP